MRRIVAPRFFGGSDPEVTSGALISRETAPMSTELERNLAPLLCGRFGTPFRHLSEIDSTNSEALRWAVGDGVSEGALVVADTQSAGRGRWGRSWFGSADGSLMFSLVLRPPAAALDLLTTTVGVATVEAVRELGVADAGLKWPNDVVVGGRKLAGILVESQSSGTDVIAIAGVGLNLDLEHLELPDDVAGRSTSLVGEGVSAERARVLAAVLSWFEPLYDSLATPEGRSRVVSLASERSVLLGREVTLTTADGAATSGVAEAITPDGALRLAGHPEPFRAGEVTLKA